MSRNTPQRWTLYRIDVRSPPSFLIIPHSDSSDGNYAGSMAILKYIVAFNGTGLEQVKIERSKGG